MTEGVLQRAGVAIVLILTLLLPYGRCQSPAHATRHDCCVHLSSPAASVKASCCTIRSEIPAIVEQRAVVSPNSLATAAAFAVAADAAMALEAGGATATLQRYSPPGKSILRI